MSVRIRLSIVYGGETGHSTSEVSQIGHLGILEKLGGEMARNLKIIIAIIVVLLVAGGVFIYLGYKKKAGQKETGKEKKGAIQHDPTGPYYHQIYSAISKDGLTWEKQGKLIFDHASVPGAVIKDGKIFLYFVDAGEAEPQLSVGISKDLGKSFEKKKVEIQDIESAQAVDPHPELIDQKIRLYYFYSPAIAGDPGKAEGKHKFYSATSDDGVIFKNPKLAYEVEELITDPDVFQTEQDWRMFISRGRNLDLLISADNGITFQKQPGFSWDKGGVVDTFNFSGIFRTYYCGQGIQSAIGAEKGKLTIEPGTRIAQEGEMIVCDPSVIQLPDDSYLMFYKVQKNLPQQNQGPGQGPGPGQVPM